MSTPHIKLCGRVAGVVGGLCLLTVLFVTPWANTDDRSPSSRSAPEPEAAAPTAGADEEPLSLSGWYSRQYRVTEVMTAVRKLAATAEHPAGVRLPVNLPEPAEFFHEIKSFKDADELVISLYFPPDFPADAELFFVVKDWDDQWLDVQVPLPQPIAGNHTFVLPIAGDAAAGRWRPKRHFRPWHQLTGNQLKEYGLKLDSPKGRPLTYEGDVYLTDVALRENDSPEPNPEIRDLRFLPQEPRVGKPIELSFQLTHPYRRPFDPEDVNLRAIVATPSGRTIPLRAFYFEDFLLDADDEFSRVIPKGRPEFRVRFTPLETGEHVLRVAGIVAELETELPEVTFKVAGNRNWKGYVQRDQEDDRLLVFSRDNREFVGLGLNVRSPYDNRYQEVFPFTAWDNFNLNMYKRLFARYEKAGINVVEVWMSSWWLALEWMPDAPGNHGVGNLNQYRAWQLDRLVEWAAEHNIYLILAINNHGKFSTWCDKEWHRNPYNRSRGGYLSRPEQFFSSNRARRDFKHLLDYIIARWSHSPHILAWKLFTEIDLTGSRSGWYTNHQVTDWHREMARHLKLHDPNRHLVTTHWSGNYGKARGSPQLAGLNELDFLTLDAYYSGHQGAQRLYNTLTATLSYQSQMEKPCIITEFGGTPWADSLPHVLQQFHLGLWKGYFGGFAIPPFLWWFPLVHEHDLYPEYNALAAFTRGETRRRATMVDTTLQDGLQQCEIRRDRDRLVWIFDRNYHFHNDRLHLPARSHNDLGIRLAGLKPGKYTAQFWNCSTGKAIGIETILAESNGTAVVRLPAFRRDIAIKVKPAD